MFDKEVSAFAERIERMRLSRRLLLATAPLLSPSGFTAHAQTPVSSPKPQELTQPEIVRSANGVFTETLRAKPAVVDIGAARPVTTFTYNGIIPGRTWEVSPGDVMSFQLINDLPDIESHEPPDMVRPHEWTTTNVHVHGMHVSPEGNSDNIFLEIKPGEIFNFEIAVPDNHPGGLFFYHPHKHGAVCQQVRAGMAGAIIVRGEIDKVPEIATASEQIMVLQAIELGDDFQLLDPIPHPSKQEAFFPRTQIFYTVNGQMTPKITMYPGEVQRWRLLNAAEGKFMSLALEGHDMHTIAWDGLTMAAPTVEPNLVMAAGNRTDILVKAGQPGTYQFMLTPGSSQRPDIPGMNHSSHEIATPGPTTNPEFDVRSILTLEVTGEGAEMQLPASLPAYDPPILPIANYRTVRYTVERGDDLEFFDFGIDGEPFNPANPPYQMKLGTAEQWLIENDVDSKLPQHAHVVHIHVNPFKVIEVNGRPLETPLWRDTFVLTGSDGDSMTIQMNLDDFTGTFVQHCHVLSHEDLGMMESLEVIP